MSEVFQWDQSRFDGILKEYLMAHESQVWPNLLNTKASFVAKAAIELTPRVDHPTIDAAMDAPVAAKQEDGPGGTIPRVIALASKRAAAKWTGSKRYQKAMARRAEGKSSNMLRAWRQEIKAQAGKIRGSRKAATAFIRLGWYNVRSALRPYVRASTYQQGGTVARLHGQMKGKATPAMPGKLSVLIENSAHALSEHRGGFERIGGPALEAAMAKEAADTAKHLEDAMEPGIRAFNRKNGH